jgi:hypothetical protein
MKSFFKILKDNKDIDDVVLKSLKEVKKKIFGKILKNHLNLIIYFDYIFLSEKKKKKINLEYLVESGILTLFGYCGDSLLCVEEEIFNEQIFKFFAKKNKQDY